MKPGNIGVALGLAMAAIGVFAHAADHRHAAAGMQAAAMRSIGH